MTKMHKPASIFRRIYDRMYEARAREANRHINSALRMLDDEALNSRGLKRSPLTSRHFHAKVL